MNREQIENDKKRYNIYILIGALYVLIKIAFVLAGYLHPGAIIHGLIPASVAIVVGVLAIKEMKQSDTIVWHRILVLVPILVFIITPIYMFFKEKEQWLINGRLEVLIIYEIMAIVQLIIALKQLKVVQQ